MRRMLLEYFCRGTSLLQKGLLLLLVLGMLCVWPLCLIWQEEYTSPGEEDYVLSEELAQGMSFTQSFRAESDYLISLEFAMDFDAERPRDGMFGFEFLDEAGNVIYDGMIPYNQLADYTFFPIEVERKVRKGEVYQYRITNWDVVENLPRVIYTEQEALHNPNNCGFFMDDAQISGEGLSRYLWKKPHEPMTVLNIWACMGVVVFIFYEVVGRKQD